MRGVRALVPIVLASGLLTLAVWRPGLSASVRFSLAIAGLGLILWGFALGTRWRSTCGWIVVTLVGQACSLQLSRVGTANQLQLFYSWEELLNSYQAVCLGIVLAQGAIAAGATFAWWRRRPWRFAGRISRTEAFVFLLLLVFCALPVSPATVRSLFESHSLQRIPVELSKFGLALFILIANGLSLALACAAIPNDAWDKIVARWRNSPRERVVRLSALWVVIASSFLAWTVLERLPHIPDEIAYVSQAKYLSLGRLWLPAPPDPMAFDIPFCTSDASRWYCATPAGWPLALAGGIRVGLPWLVNPLLGGIAILLAHALLRRLYGKDTADGVAILLAVSPWLLYMSANLMTHNLTLVLMLLGFLSVQNAREGGAVLWGGLAGFAFGALLHVRPLEAVAVAAVAGIWFLTGKGQSRWLGLGACIVVGLVMTGAFLAYNQAITGSPWRVPLSEYVEKHSYPGSNRLGFGADVGNLGWRHLDPLLGHGPIDVAVNTNYNLYMVNFELFGWACGSLLFVLLLVVWRRWRDDVLAWGILLALWAAMTLYWFSGGPDYGARYWYLMILPFALLTVRGAQEWSARWSQEGGSRVWAFLLIASLVGLINVMPWRALDKYRNYRGVRADVRKLAQEREFGRSLVFVRGEPVQEPWSSLEFASAFALNPPNFDPEAAGTIYVRDMGPESRERLRRYYADRPVWVVEVPEVTGSGFRVVEGPLPPTSSRAPVAPH
jgi:hypothetical protein